MNQFLQQFYRNISTSKKQLIPEKHYKEYKTKDGKPGKTPTLGLTDKEIVESFKKCQEKYIEIWACYQTVRSNIELDPETRYQFNELEGLLFDLERRLKINREGVNGPGRISAELHYLMKTKPKEFREAIFRMIKDKFDNTDAKETEIAKRLFQDLEPIFSMDLEKNPYWSSAKSLLQKYRDWKAEQQNIFK